MNSLNLKNFGKLLTKKQVGIPLLVLATALITTVVVLALVGNEPKEFVQGAAIKESPATVTQTTQDATGVVPNANSGSPVVTNPSKAPSVATNKPSGPTTPKNGPVSTPAPVPTTPTPKPTPQPTGSIAFSSDGCFVAMTGAPGWILTGVAEGGFLDGTPRKGGPLGDPDGYVMPASGSTTVQVGFAGYDWADWRLTATLYDQSGAIKVTKVVFIDAASAALCP